MDILKRVFTSEVKGIDDVEKTITAYISTGARDRMDESLDPIGMDMKNFSKNPVVMWAHDYTQPPIGKALWTKRDGEGVLSKVKFANTEFAQEIFQLYKEGFLKAFSVGFIPKEAEDGDGVKSPRRTFKKWELLEYSAVPVPANPEALALAISKGILKSEDLRKSFEVNEEIKEGEPEVKADPNQMMKCQDCGCKCKASKMDNGKCPECGSDNMVKMSDMGKTFNEIYAEIKLLADRVAQLTSENGALRYKLYQVTQVKEEKTPEITGKDYAHTVADVVARVIRQHQGKLN